MFVRRVVGRVYTQTIRKLLPITDDVGQSSNVRNVNQEKRAFDSRLPWHVPSIRPNFKSSIISAIDKYTQPGDDVIVIGGGDGITAVHEGNQVGDGGQVVVYEAVGNKVENIKINFEMNEVPCDYMVKHAIIGDIRDANNKTGISSKIPPSNLPTCDVLELDCEGAESIILERLDSRPRTMIIEIHPNQGAPEDEIREKLFKLGYEIVDTYEGFYVHKVLVAQEDE